MRMARRAGRAHATSPTNISTADTAIHVTGSVGSTPKSNTRTNRTATSAPARPNATPIATSRSAAQDDHLEDRRGRRAERQPDADFGRALTRRVRHHAVQPDGRQQQRDAAQTAHELHHRPLLDQASG